jgi:HD superfamily phosphohydrolase
MLPLLSLRDPVHGFVRADELEAALVNSAPVQRLRCIHQLGLTHLVFPGAEHSRFSHVLGAMELAGRVYDALAAKSNGLLPVDPSCRERRLVRAAALLHDIGHAPFSHSAEDQFEGGIDHEEMTRRLLALPEIAEAFERHGDGLQPGQIADLLAGRGDEIGRLLSKIISGELDADKMDYLLRDSLFCGVRYGSYDLERLLDTIVPLHDPAGDGDGSWGIGVEAGGVHALEALVLARYYMFTQVYFNGIGKALELHLSAWLRERGERWPSDPEAFLAHDDVSVLTAMRACDSAHARAVVHRDYFPIAHESREHLSRDESARFAAILPALEQRFGATNLLVSHSAKDPHRLGKARVLVRYADGLEPMEEASHFIRHLTRIDQYRVYAAPELRDQVQTAIEEALAGGQP